MRIVLRARALLYPALGALFLAGTLQAGLVSTVNAGGQFTYPFQSFGCSDAGTGTASCSVPSLVYPHEEASGSYQANARYGSLDVTSMSAVYGGFLHGTSTASFSETLLLTGGIGSGTLMFVAEYWGFGKGESCDRGSCRDNSAVSLNAFTAHPNSMVPVITNVSFSFFFGTPFNLSASASASSSALGSETATQTAHLQIDAIKVLDSNGALITNYALTSDSGDSSPVVTPEPGTFTLVIAAFIALLFIRRKSISACRIG